VFTLLSEKIRVLTLNTTDLVVNEQIEQCLNVLVERQALLEKLAQTYQEYSQHNDDRLSAEFTELIQWIQQQDATNYHKIIKLREQSKKDSINQVKAKKAILHYKKLT
jgi:predicted house-cleaning noncanonical NTP pyrophosphatase (MazG superfamily)